MVSRKKWIKRIGIAAAALAGVVLGTLLVVWMLLRATPAWYRPTNLTAEQREAAAQNAQNKLIVVQNAAAQARADERVAQRNATTLPSSANTITLTLTDEEINALLEKWTVWPTVKAGYEKFMSDPRILLEDGRLILAGHVGEVDALASVHFAPRIDEDGNLRIEMVRVQAGKLPLPQGLLARYQQQAAGAVQWRLPRWRAGAKIDDTGAANLEAVNAVMGKLLMDMLTNEASDPVTFVPLVDGKIVTVKLISLRVEQGKLTLTVQPMTAGQRATALQRIKSGWPRPRL
jgi:uncharacterized protein YpmS